ncbi:senescence-induced receptor-like serine/threonine-protein kinase [Musa acuminata AAA Group]|uniref:senescence-induced receptor-like serine/threonine-protein kinase n=1 Tax=Musa acuminata AAA Group TaxID=214697 RepID=UPI0031DF8AB4
MAPWFFLLLEIAVLVTVHGQDSRDFISIDCGITSNTNYTHGKTDILYVSDDQFTDTGINHQVASNYVSSSLDELLLTVRSFPNASRSCYVLKPVIQYRKYIVRATFMYGNYDGLNRANAVKPLLFDLYMDVNFWQTVNVSDPTSIYEVEAVAVALADSVSVCLVDTGSGTPFISALELRPLVDVMYPSANTSQSLVLNYRLNIGPSTNSSALRYPDDPYDRIWRPWTSPDAWMEISTTETISNSEKDLFQPPTAVMQTAATPSGNSSKMEFYWTFADAQVPNNEFYVNLFFTEFERNTSRLFNVYLNDVLLKNYTPPYGSVGYLYSTRPLDQASEYHWALNSTGLSTLPPILNAIEVFTAMHLTRAATASGDADAINAIKEQYQVKRSWMGDPCAPEQFPWDGLNCSYGTDSSRIIAINLSSSALTGVISSSFAKLTEIKYLDLSYNNLTGPIPDALGTLSSLQVLNLTGNNLNGSIPASLLKKLQQGALTFSYEGNPNLGTDGTSNGSKKKSGTPMTVTYIVVPVVVVLLLVVIIFVVWRVRKFRGSTQDIHARPMIDNFSIPATVNPENPFQHENRQFSYKELEKITRKFTNVLGKGGFGTVFLGYLEDGTRVAVKTRSESSSQGTKEFLAEAQNLAKIHHRNLVSLVGYCMDGEHLALVYEFMSQGTLQDHLRDKTPGATALTWGQRLQIAVEAAQGLEYLHKGCKPPLVHRDVKSANILLSESLEAKIADFGLSRAFDNANHTHVSTAVVGTPGYLDPEYSSSYQLSAKSDVYSFGVVLFELMTGQPPVVATGNHATGLAQWARQKLNNGNIEDVIDPKLTRGYDINSVWKAADVALRCTEHESRRRPTMADVVMELKESFALESAYYRSEFPSTTSNWNPHTQTASERSQTSAFEVEQFPRFTPSAR